VALMESLIEEANAGVIDDCYSEFRMGSNVDSKWEIGFRWAAWFGS